ncbi:UDP-N-acetylmuramate dehydrogenase [Oceanihabitans sediminis]|uniref:UDP-N-acetylenolpyruvoylglucosamine reductase n=1 Tax=Oceanihabitans sediminis TaxID=1812012 RepID=A0A368P8S7_9FLAO|nr:UDP-N-acetylmuramate dehydrogenase [Oceanihabitans sediminis]MDX1278884.1 UDP-N-acetylmuramate dehydrogenase [Oceanihabitans sediminis]MDX1773833.1 UDP-N-acetylmuramate dehydrogenase [Oceanihabitans sediminis]RBP32143.1 UDP-N-acetylmuramate dehydrogenase [Oceanihabitans sediminis]RCU58793.1 UDP-N-acetylmuramate dehydrogenase [Oceanihabitans sediminis]
MQIHHNISLKEYNTFGIDAKAKHFASISSNDDLIKTLQLSEYPNRFILGGGSNMLLTKDIDALVMHINIKGINIISEYESSVLVKANAGENWHEFVLWCLQNNFGGIENLSLIPGNVGTAPIQNIGAYGVEVKDTIVSCEALEIATLKTKTFTNNECNFDYRNSVFKQELKGKYIITSVTFKLTKNNHVLRTQYGAITTELENMQVEAPTIQDISKAVIAIRESKLPNPKEIGNSGSFFKNPIIPIEDFNSLKLNFPEIPNYPVSTDSIKIPAGWLIEKAGFKGKRFGDYGVHKNQALVLVNYGNAKGSDILNLSKLIQETIKRIFNISIEAEVNII